MYDVEFGLPVAGKEEREG